MLIVCFWTGVVCVSATRSDSSINVTYIGGDSGSCQGILRGPRACTCPGSVCRYGGRHATCSQGLFLDGLPSSLFFEKKESRVEDLHNVANQPITLASLCQKECKEELIRTCLASGANLKRLTCGGRVLDAGPCRAHVRPKSDAWAVDSTTHLQGLHCKPLRSVPSNLLYKNDQHVQMRVKALRVSKQGDLHNTCCRGVLESHKDVRVPAARLAMSRPCRFFNTPAGCNRGSQCKFVHAIPQNAAAGARPLSPSSASDASAGPPPQRPAHPGSAGNPPPPGVCRFFWEQGRCNREFNCRYRHSQRVDAPTTPPPPPVAPPVARSAALQRVAPFLTEQGLAKMSGSGTDGFFSPDPDAALSPSEAHNALKRYLSDYFRFKSTPEMYAFVKPLNNATAANANWVCRALL